MKWDLWVQLDVTACLVNVALQDLLDHKDHLEKMVIKEILDHLVKKGSRALRVKVVQLVPLVHKAVEVNQEQ